MTRSLAGLLAIASLVGAGRAGAQAPLPSRCESLAQALEGHWPDATTRLVSARLVPEGPYTPSSMPGGPPATPITLPEHCDVVGVLHERIGVADQHYAIRFHLRLPTEWNGRFFFQGGGGSDGVIGDALGPTARNAPSAIVQGYAVVSQDSGHDNATNSDPARGGAVAFGFDPTARADYGHSSLKPVADAAKAAVTAYYGKAPHYSYFVGCSKGGQEGMVFAQRHPQEFDGIVAAAPGFSLPRAAVAEAWDVQQIASVVRALEEHNATSTAAPAAPAASSSPTATTTPMASAAPTATTMPIARFADAFTDGDLHLVADAVLSVCDADDGLKDGLIADFSKCTPARVRPALEALACAGAKTPSCLAKEQLSALKRIYGGAKDGKGRALYSDWQWDAGIAGPGWRQWKLGTADHRLPAFNVALGGASLAAVFTTPPTVVSADLAATGRYQLEFDFDRDAAKIYATNADFSHSAWEDVSARSPDLDAFRARGGKLIVPHGVSDPVFSIHDTLAWYRDVDRRNHGQAARFVRVFAVPGMTHCGGGPTTDEYDAFVALTRWVEHGEAPDRIVATAGAGTPWPGRSRPLCPFPAAAHYVGRGDSERADSFACR
jgi:feruloyl esterase